MGLLLVWKQKLKASMEVSKLRLKVEEKRFSSRRAVGLVPHPLVDSGREVVESEKLRFQQLFISLEGNESTCCFKVISPTRRSRGAILVFRGRVLGCVYGRKELGGQVLGDEAFSTVLADMAAPNSLVDHYKLPEKLAIASSSLFHGDVLSASDSGDMARSQFEYFFSRLQSSQMPGSIVVRKSSSQEVVSFVYMFGGQIQGIYTNKDGWLPNSLESCYAMLSGSQSLSVSACQLNATNIEQVLELSFSLTGMDKKLETGYGSSLIAIDGNFLESSIPGKHRWSHR